METFYWLAVAGKISTADNLCMRAVILDAILTYVHCVDRLKNLLIISSYTVKLLIFFGVILLLDVAFSCVCQVLYVPWWMLGDSRLFMDVVLIL